MLRILIVEDNDLAALYLENIVKDISTATVTITASVADTKNALNGSFDFAFLDVDVTNGKTYEVAHSLKEKRIPFIFVSGSPPEDIPQELRFAPFIAKPFEPAQIAGALNSLLSKWD